MSNQYPDSLDAVGALRLLIASVDKLMFEMGGVDATKDCTDLLTKWDEGNPTIFYLIRNLEWARQVLNRDVSEIDKVD